MTLGNVTAYDWYFTDRVSASQRMLDRVFDVLHPQGKRKFREYRRRLEAEISRECFPEGPFVFCGVEYTRFDGGWFLRPQSFSRIVNTLFTPELRPAAQRVARSKALAIAATALSMGGANGKRNHSGNFANFGL